MDVTFLNISVACEINNKDVIVSTALKRRAVSSTSPEQPESRGDAPASTRMLNENMVLLFAERCKIKITNAYTDRWLRVLVASFLQ
jgi:hypothetical protein